MSGLKEKAKTTDEICTLLRFQRMMIKRDSPTYENDKKYYNELCSNKWVRLEDAQKEIEFQKARANVANEMVTSKQKRIDELKQKLLGLLNEYPSNDGIDIPYDDEIRVTRLIQWKQKLERFINGL